jgi:hypothetical protein
LQKHEILKEFTLEMQDKACHYFVDLEHGGVGGFNNIEDNGSKGSQD